MARVDLCRTGLPVIGEVPWGTHLCQLYRSRADLEESLVPFFAAGLILVAVGAVTILITAPRPGKKPTHDDHAAKAAGTRSVFERPAAKSHAAPSAAAEPASDAAQVAAGEANSADNSAAQDGKSDSPDESWSEPEKA